MKNIIVNNKKRTQRELMNSETGKGIFFYRKKTFFKYEVIKGVNVTRKPPASNQDFYP